MPESRNMRFARTRCCAMVLSCARKARAISPMLKPPHRDQLGLIFLTCHPSLAPDARVALALKLAAAIKVGKARAVRLAS